MVTINPNKKIRRKSKVTRVEGFIVNFIGNNLYVIDAYTLLMLQQN